MDIKKARGQLISQKQEEDGNGKYNDSEEDGPNVQPLLSQCFCNVHPLLAFVISIVLLQEEDGHCKSKRTMDIPKERRE